MVGVGPWIKRLWDMLDLPKTVTIKNPADGSTISGVPMWVYWCLQEGTLGVDRAMQKTNDGKMPPVIHVDSDAPLLSDEDGSLITDELWGIYYKPDFYFGGIQGGAAPYEVEKDAEDVAVDPYGPESSEFIVGPDFAHMWVSALAHCQKRFSGTLPKFNREPSGGIGAFSPHSFPVFDVFRHNCYVIADSNHGYKMLGHALAYLDTGKRDATPLVLIHGYTDSARDWVPIAPQLAPKFRLIIVDLRGHGASAKPECCYTRFDFAYDVKLLLAKLRIDVADITGHSLGSIVAQTFAELWPEATRKLILISSTGLSFGATGEPCAFTTSDPSRSDWMAGLAELKDPIDPDSEFMHDWWHISISVNPEFFSRRQRHDAAAIPARAWRAIADQSLVGVDLRSMLPRIQAPTLLIWDAKDTVFVEAGKNALISGIAGAEVRTFNALGHDPFWEDPRAIADAMIGFLESSPEDAGAN